MLFVSESKRPIRSGNIPSQLTDYIFIEFEQTKLTSLKFIKKSMNQTKLSQIVKKEGGKKRMLFHGFRERERERELNSTDYRTGNVII